MKHNYLCKALALSTLVIGTFVATSIVTTSCHDDSSTPSGCNPLTDFDVEVSTIQQYAIKVTGTDDPNYLPPDIDPDVARNLEGIIILGWKDEKPRLAADGKTVYVHLADSYDYNGRTYPVIALGSLCFGQEMYDDWSTTYGARYDYNFILPASLRIMFNSACSWFGAIPAEMLPICVNSIKGFTGKETKYPHIKVDMSQCNLYADSEDPFLQSNPFRGAYNYNFAFQQVDEFLWPINNTTWGRIADDIMEDAYINCDMDLRGLKGLWEIGHWGCGRWQMPSHDLYLPNFTSTDAHNKFHLTWEAFNGSRFKDVYWNIPTDKLVWDDDFHLDIDVLNDDLHKLAEWLETTFPDEDVLWNILDPLVQAIVDEAANIWDKEEDGDVFIMGNLEIQNFYTSNPNYWKEYCQPYADATPNPNTPNTNGHGDSYPNLFWELGMADCPSTQKIDNFLQIS